MGHGQRPGRLGQRGNSVGLGLCLNTQVILAGHHFPVSVTSLSVLGA